MQLPIWVLQPRRIVIGPQILALECPFVLDGVFQPTSHGPGSGWTSLGPNQIENDPKSRGNAPEYPRASVTWVPRPCLGKGCTKVTCRLPMCCVRFSAGFGYRRPIWLGLGPRRMASKIEMDGWRDGLNYDFEGTFFPCIPHIQCFPFLGLAQTHLLTRVLAPSCPLCPFLVCSWVQMHPIPDPKSVGK